MLFHSLSHVHSSLSLSIFRFWGQFSCLGRVLWKPRLIFCSPSTSYSQIGREAGKKQFICNLFLKTIPFKLNNLKAFSRQTPSESKHFSLRNTILFLSAVSSAVTITKTSVDMYCSESYRSKNRNQVGVFKLIRIEKTNFNSNSRTNATPNDLIHHTASQGDSLLKVKIKR